MLLEKFNKLNHPPRHGFDYYGDRGIMVSPPFGRTIITASLPSHKDPHNKQPNVDFSARETAVWLTFPAEYHGENYDFVIGPDGMPSSIAVKWRNGVAEMFMEIDGKMQKIEGLNRNEGASFSNLPLDSETTLLEKEFKYSNPEKNTWEFYGIARLSEGAKFLDETTFRRFISKETLVSGMRNRGLRNYLSTFFWALRPTDKSELPFGRDLPKR